MTPVTAIKRTRPLLALTLAAGVCAAAATGAGANGAPTAHAGRVAKVMLRHTSRGKLLVDSSGFTLYRFTRDTGHKNTCVTLSECSGTWPALATSGKPTAGPGVQASLLSTITLPNGSKQVTYAGHPLYRYGTASERGETVYIGAQQFGGTWYAVSAAGRFVK